MMASRGCAGPRLLLPPTPSVDSVRQDRRVTNRRDTERYKQARHVSDLAGNRRNNRAADDSDADYS